MQSSEKLELSAGGQSQHYSAKAQLTFIFTYMQIARSGNFERIIYQNNFVVRPNLQEETKWTSYM